MRDALGTGFGDGVYALDARATLWGPNLYLPWSADSGPPPVTATLAVTLAAKTLASSAAVAVAATLAHTLAAKTVAATATVTTQGGGGGASWMARRRRTRRRRR